MPLARCLAHGPVFTGARIATFDLPAAAARSGSLRLVLKNLEKTEDSVRLRLLAAPPGGTPQAIGELYTYGEGPRRPGDDAERFSPVTMSLDVTASAGSFAGKVEVYLKVFDAHDREITGLPIRLESVELSADNGPS